MKSQSQAVEDSAPPLCPRNRRKRKGSDRSERSFDRRGENVVELVLELLDSVLKKVRLDSAHDCRKSLVETIVKVLESAGKCENYFKV